MTARADARHLIGCLRNCLLGEAADALLRVVQAHARRLEERYKRDGDRPLPPDWLADLSDADGGSASESHAAQAERRRVLLLALDRASVAFALPAAATGDANDDETPEAASVRLAVAEFGLDELDGAVLLLALRCSAGSPIDQ